MCIFGVGVDMIEIKKFKKILLSKAKKDFLKNNFTKKEISSVKNEMGLAANFAAKEAVFKAFGTGWTNGKEVEVLRGSKGAPKIKLCGKIKEIAKKKKIKKVLVSLSYTECCAVAVAVISS